MKAPPCDMELAGKLVKHKGNFWADCDDRSRGLVVPVLRLGRALGHGWVW